jgi:sugar/nucleoside kinase (ribokinase family)
VTSPNHTDRVPVVCVGVLVADHLSTPISHLPAAGELVMADDLVLNIGGNASNAGMALAKLGIRATVCGRVGKDVFGRFVSDTLANAGVDVSSLAVDPTRATSQSLIVNVKGQDRRFVHSFGANASLTAADLDPLIALNPRVLFVGGYMILPGLTAEGLASRFQTAKRNGAYTVLDIATPGPADYIPHFTPVLPHVDFFLPNTDEAALILGEHDPVKQADAFHKMGAKTVVITCGSEGSVVISNTLRARIRPYPVEFVDGTGGGDAFAAGFITGLLEDLDELSRLKLASAIGASCVRAVGTTAGIFTRAEADEFIAKNVLRVEPI